MNFYRTIKPSSQILPFLLSLLALSLAASPCLPGFTFYPSTNLCTVNCSLYFNTIPSSLDPAYQWGCVCKSPFVWSPKDLSCLRLVNCSKVALSNDKSNNVEICNCVENTQWNEVTMECEVDCQKFDKRKEGKGCACQPNEEWIWPKGCVRKCWEMVGADRTKLRDAGGNCSCFQGFVWNGSDCAIDCPKIERAFQENGSCRCPEGYALNTTTAQCVLNCSLYENTDPLFSLGTASNCSCIPGYSWSSSPTPACQPTSSSYLSACSPPRTLWNPLSLSCQRNCSDVPSSTGIRLRDKCQCVNRWIWDEQSQKCLLLCRGIPTSDSKCGCLKYYEWDNTKNRCVPNCRKMPFADLSIQKQEICRCILGYSFVNSVCVATPAYLPYTPPQPTLFSFSYSQSDLRQALHFEQTLAVLIDNIPLDFPYGLRLKSIFLQLLRELYNHLVFMDKEVRLEIREPWQREYIGEGIKNVLRVWAEIGRQVNRKGKTNVVTGLNNLVSIKQDSAPSNSQTTSQEPTPQYLSVTGNRNALSGNRILLSGESISQSGTDSVLLGRNIHSMSSNSIVVGEGTRVISNSLLILGKYQIDLSRWRKGEKRYVRVVEGNRDHTVPRYL